MAAGGGDIDAAMKSRKVPVTLKARRTKLKEQIAQAQQFNAAPSPESAVASGDVPPQSSAATLAGDAKSASQSVDEIAATIHASINDRANKKTRAYYDKEVARGVMTAARAEAEVARGLRRDGEPGERTRDLAQAIADKDPRPLVNAWAMDGKSLVGSEGSAAVFEKMTGVKLARLNATDRAQAIFGWAGWTKQQADEYLGQRRERKQQAMQEREAEDQRKRDNGAVLSAERQNIQLGKNGEVVSIRAYVDGLIAQGFDALHAIKRGAVTRHVLANKEGRGHILQSGPVLDYARVALSRKQAAIEDAANPAQQAVQAAESVTAAANEAATSPHNDLPEPVKAAPTEDQAVADLRRQLREVEDKIMAAAPASMAKGGGDIEAAMKSRAVPVTLKAQRKKLKEQIQQAQSASESQSNQPQAQTQQAQAATENVAPDAEQSPAQETTYNGTRIYPTKIKVGDEVKSMWAVESPDNRRRRAAGERTIGGDSLHDTIEQAKAAAEREAKRDAEQRAAKAEQDAADKARLDAEEARKAANRPKTVVERRKDAILDGPSKIGQGTKRAVITTAVDNGYAIEAKMVYDHAAKKRDQEAVDRASRAGYILGVSNENLPLVKAGNEAKARLKEGKYEKPEYRVYQGSDTKAPFREITKTEYDYAQELKAQRAAAPQAEAAQPATPQRGGNDFLPEGWTKSVNGFTKRPVYRMEQGVGQPFAVVTQTDGMTYEVQIRHGDKQLTTGAQRGALSEVLAAAEAELGRMTQADSVTHADPGEKAEAATPAVVTDSLKKAASNEDTKPSEMRKWLVAEIDKELLQAPDRADYDEAVKRLGEKDAISMFTGNGPLGKNSETGFITFDVPGDGKYKVRNSVRGLLEFRKNVMASQGFKDSGQKRVKPEQNRGVQGGSGGSMAAINNMIEEGDFEAARDYAEAVGIKLEDVKVPRGENAHAWKVFLSTGKVPEPKPVSREWTITNEQNPNGAWSRVAKLKRTADGVEYEATVTGTLDNTRATYVLTKDGKEYSRMTSGQPFSAALELAENAMPKANDKPAPSKASDTGWNMAGTGFGGKRYIGRNITLDDGREVVARVYENAGTYEEAEVKVDGVRKFTVTDRESAQDKADAFIKTLIDGEQKAEDTAAPQDAAEKRFNVPTPPTWDYRLKQRGGSTYLIPPVGQAFTPETRSALRDWARDAGYSASIITDNEVSVAAVTGGPSLDYIVDGVKEQAYGRQADKERSAMLQNATGPRRDPTKVSMFHPYEDGDIVAIDGQDWTVKQDTPGWYLTNTGNWRGTHPTIRNIKAMADLIREVEQAATASPAAQPEAPKLTPAEAKSLMEWQDLGQKDGVKTHALTFYESQADKDAKRGRMIVAKVTKGDRSASNWMVDGDDKPLAVLGMAKKRAEEIGMAKAVADGFVAEDNPFAEYNALAKQYGYEVRPDGAIGSDGKFPGPTMKVKGGRLRIESGSGNLLASYAGTSPDGLGKFLESFWYAEKKSEQALRQEMDAEQAALDMPDAPDDEKVRLLAMAGSDRAADDQNQNDLLGNSAGPMYSRAAKQSTERNLLITHNLTPENLLHAVKMGGLAAPSLAVTTNTEVLTKFGSITLVGKREMADPKADELATKRARLKELVSVLDANNKQAPAASEQAAEEDDAAYMGAPDNEGAERQYRDTEKAYGGKPAYDKAKAAGKTKLNYRQWVQVRTPNFKAWFGDWEGDPKNASKVVDPDTGEPMVVYHGTRADFSAFDPEVAEDSVGGWWFTDNNNYAYGMAHGGWDTRGAKDPNAVIMSVYLRMNNPMRYDVFADGVRIADEIGVDRPEDSDQAMALISGDIGWDEVVADIVRDAQRAGHDGLIIENFQDGRLTTSTAYIAYSQGQIKSATSNNGNFDRTDVRIDHFAAKQRQRQGSTVDRAVMDMAREGQPARDILRLIADTSKSRFNRQVARLLLKTGITPRVEALAVGGLGKDKRGFNLLAKYSRDHDTVSLTEGSEYMAEQIMLHELIHAATLKALDKPGLHSLQMRRLYEHVKRQGGAAGQYGMKNVGEFVAEAFTNPEFQRLLRQMDAPPGGTLKSAWDGFVRILRSILGLPQSEHSALSQALELGVAVMREDMALRQRGVVARGRDAQAGIDQTQTEAFKRWFGDSKVVDNSFANLLSKPDGVGILLRDLLAAQNASGSGLNPVQALMLALAKNDKIGRGIVGLVPVDVVNSFTKDGFRPEDGGGNTAMFVNALNTPVSDQVLSTFRGILTSLSAKLANTIATGRDKEVGPALLASDFNLREMGALLSLQGRADFWGGDAGVESVGASKAAKSSSASLRPPTENLKLSPAALADLLNKFVSFAPHSKSSISDDLPSSKYIAEQGKPLVVYRGGPTEDWQSGAEITEFRSSNGPWAGFFTNSSEVASRFANAQYALTRHGGKPAGVFPVYLSMQKPLEVDAGGKPARDFQIDASVLGKQDHPLRERMLSGDYDGLILRNTEDEGDVFVPLNPNQIKSAIGNNGNFDPEDADIAHFGAAELRGLKDNALDRINTVMSHPGKVSLWDKTVGTMRNLADRAPAFKPVFEAAQRFIDDVALLANDAADMAPRVLPRVDTWRDLAKKPISAADNKAVAKPLFEGTLLWARDANDKPVLVSDLEKRYANLPAEDKAQMMLKLGKLDAGVLRMWRGMEQDRFEALVNSRFENQMLKAGVVWSDKELADIFKATPHQISLYRETRKAIDRSIDMTARADMLRVLGEDFAGLRDAVLEQDSLGDAMEFLISELTERQRANPDDAQRLTELHHSIVDRAERARDLMDKGYAPLSRFGRYTVDVVDASGERQYFGMYESKADSNRAAMQMRAAFPGATVTQGTMSQEAYKLFAGITPESLELFGNMLGLDEEGGDARDKVFQEYLKLTKNNHSALKRLIHRQGIAGFSEDVGRVLAAFVYSNARQSAGALNAGTIDKAVNAIPKEQGELKDVAMGLRNYIRDPQEEGQAVRGMLFAQYLGGSVASAFVNMTQPFAVTMPWLSQYGGIKSAGAHLAKALKDMGTKGFKYEADLAAALKHAEDDGVVSPQEIHQLMAQARGSGSLRSGDGTKVGEARAAAANAWERTKVAWGQPFALAEQFNRRSTFIAAYRIAKEQKMADPAAFARRAVEETQFVYSKAAKSRWMRGAIGGTLMTFKSYSIQYLELLHRMWTQGGPEGKRAVGWAMVMLMLAGGAGGLPFMEDLEDLIDGIAQLMGYNVSSKQWRQRALRQVLGKEFAEFMEQGVSGLPGAPVDVSGRFGLGNLIPGTGLLLQKPNRERDLLEIAGPAGDLIKRGFTGGRKLLTGDVGGAALEVSPTAVRNAAKGADMAASGIYKDAKGYKVIDTTLGEALAKAGGFQPRSVAQVQEANSFMLRSRSFYQQNSAEIKAQWADALFRKDEAALERVRERLAAWNRDNPEQPIVVKMPDVWKRVREMGKDRTQRIADTAPKALRQQMREMARENG